MCVSQEFAYKPPIKALQDVKTAAFKSKFVKLIKDLSNLTFRKWVLKHSTTK